MQELSLIIFVFNEEQNLAPVVEATISFLSKTVGRFELILVDDGSTDKTYSLMQTLAQNHRCVRVLHHTTNQGIGAALRDGYAAARYSHVTFLPSDGQIAAPELAKVFAMATPDVDVVSSYYRRRTDTLLRRLVSRSLRLLLLCLFGPMPRLEGIYLFKRSLLDRFPLLSDSFVLNFEFIIRACRAKARFAVVEIECAPRMSGQSKVFSWRKIWFVFKEVLRLRCQLR